MELEIVDFESNLKEEISCPEEPHASFDESELLTNPPEDSNIYSFDCNEAALKLEHKIVVETINDCEELESSEHFDPLSVDLASSEDEPTPVSEDVKDYTYSNIEDSLKVEQENVYEDTPIPPQELETSVSTYR